MKVHPDAWRALLAWLTLIVFGLLVGQLMACGGVDSGGTGQTVDQPMQTSSVGRVSGFGSVIVNGVRFDDSQARIVDDAGVAYGRADLKLGMVVDIEGEVLGNSGNGVARSIQFGSEISGPLESIDATAGRLVVLGQMVKVDADTLFGGTHSGVADLVVGDLLAVFAFYDPSAGIYTATRIERQTALAAYKLRGRISDLDDTSFAIGDARIDYSGIAAPQLPRLADGLSVRVTLQPVPVARRWVATSVRTSQRSFPDDTEAEVEGFISSFVSTASFVVAGVTVDASVPGVSVTRGTLSQLANGQRIEVKGEMSNGVLVASEIEFKRAGGGEQEFELRGLIESADAAAQTFVLRGVTVAYGAGTVFAPGRPADLVAGARLEVRGVPTSGGTGLLARMIKVE
jgi:hypothetical protein